MAVFTQNAMFVSLLVKNHGTGLPNEFQAPLCPL